MMHPGPAFTLSFVTSFIGVWFLETFDITSVQDSLYIGFSIFAGCLSLIMVLGSVRSIKG